MSDYDITGNPTDRTGKKTRSHAAQLFALEAELKALKASVQAYAPPEPVSAGAAFEAMAGEVEQLLRRDVFASVTVAAVVGYLWGRLR